jgi:hypothetical protein
LNFFGGRTVLIPAHPPNTGVCVIFMTSFFYTRKKVHLSHLK